MRGISRFTILAAFVILCWPLLQFGTSTLVAQITWEDRTPGVLNHRYRIHGPDAWMYQVHDSLWRSSDAGLNWERISLPALPEKRDLWFWDWRSDGNALLTFVKVHDYRDSCFATFAFTSDNGRNWEVKSFRIVDKLPMSKYARPQEALFAGASALLFCVDGAVYRSTDRGDTFERCNVPTGVTYLTTDEAGNGFAYPIQKQAARTTDGGVSWEMLDVPDYFQRIEFHPNGLLAGIGSSVCLSASMGDSWMRVPLPECAETASGKLRVVAVAAIDTSDIWLFTSEFETGENLLMTRDGGKHWSWEAAPAIVTSAKRLDLSRALLEVSGLTLATVPERRPLVLNVSDRSNFLRSEVLLDWNDPGCAGQVQSYTLERSGADSLWIRIDPSPDTASQYMYIVLPKANSSSYRYRLTLHAASGETYTAVSDSLSTRRGKYVDIIDALLPGPEDGVSELTYEHRRISLSRNLSGGYDTLDTTVTVVYARLPVEHPSPWTTVYPLQKTVRYPSGETTSAVARINLWADRVRHWTFDDEGFGFSQLAWPWPGIRDGNGSYHRAGVRSIPAEHAGVTTESDSIFMHTMKSVPLKGEHWYDFVLKPATGFLYSSEGSYNGHHDIIRFVSGVNDLDDSEHRLITTALTSAWPNPFATETMLSYSVGTSEVFRLSIHDLLGREISLLAEGLRTPGNYTLAFRAHDLPSGMYLVRLQAGCRVETKMIVRAR